MDRVETRELEHFVAVAEELHFGRAAQRLGIAQHPLSRAIGRLERRIGVQLFERTSRRVGLTAAGTVFLVEVRKALTALDAAVSLAQHTDRPRRLVLATLPDTGAGLLASVLRAPIVASPARPTSTSSSRATRSTWYATARRTSR